MRQRVTLRIVGAAVLAGLLGLAAPARAQKGEVPIWPGAAPGSEKWTQKEVAFTYFGNQQLVRNVVRPTLTLFLPKAGTANGTAVIVAPGGGFRMLSWESEGTQVALWLAERGVAAFVLKYRLVDTGVTQEEFQKKFQAMLDAASRRRADDKPGKGPLDDPETAQVLPMAAEDGRQAIRVVRRRAVEWGVQPDRVGLMGFSAGGLVANEAALTHDTGSRPSFVAAIYGAPFGDVTVPGDAPPLFILCADDDQLVARNSARLYSKWKEAGKPSEIHIYARGGHGFGMRKRGLPVDQWIERFGEWLDTQGLMKPAR